MYIFLSNAIKEERKDDHTMETHLSKQGLRLVGKSWEIRAKLRQWKKSKLTLQEFLRRQTRIRNQKSQPDQ